MLRPIFKVLVDGVDYTSRFDPVLQEIEVTDVSGSKSDTANIKVADPDGRIYMPRQGAMMMISLGHEGQGVGLVFRGKVDQVRFYYAKGSGRELAISAKGFDSTGNTKQPYEKHKDNTTFGAVAQQWGKAAGLKSVKVEGALASIHRKYWAMQHESYLHWGERMAREIGATFRISGDEAIFVPRNGGMSFSGQGLASITAQAGVNLINCDVDPYTGRPHFSETRGRWYDPKKHEWKEKKAKVADVFGSAKHRHAFGSTSESAAQNQADSEGKEVERNKGGGVCTIIGDVGARPEGGLALIGCRAGVDGSYKIKKVIHTLTKRDGFTTKLEFGKPDGGAGKDSRKSSS